MPDKENITTQNRKTNLEIPYIIGVKIKAQRTLNNIKAFADKNWEVTRKHLNCILESANPNWTTKRLKKLDIIYREDMRLYITSKSKH